MPLFCFWKLYAWRTTRFLCFRRQRVHRTIGGGIIFVRPWARAWVRRASRKQMVSTMSSRM